MQFSDYEQTVYSKNPLRQVICQVRFSPILRIDAELPAVYQDKVREEYPRYEEAEDFAIPVEVAQQLPLDLLKVIKPQTTKTHIFASLDQEWSVSLTRNFLALTTSKYRSWDEFRRKFAVPYHALQEIYRPGAITRVGLRYQNVIQRSALGLSGDYPWGDLISLPLAGLLARSSLDALYTLGVTNVDSITSVAEMAFDADGFKAKAQYGLVIDNATKEQCYLIDTDFYHEGEIGGQHVSRELDKFNDRATRFFQWCISETLHAAMGPEIRHRGAN